MLNRYYQDELVRLRDLAVEFSRAHPALAPMLSGSSADPDVERLLEGVAFLTGMVRQKLDDEFPEFVQELAQLLFPHYLRPVPCSTIMVFSPKGRLSETATVRAGTAVDSVPVDGTRCTFRTTSDLEVHPLALSGAQVITRPGTPPLLRLSLLLDGMDLGRWAPRSLRLFLGGPLADASRMLLLLTRHVREVRVSAAGGETLLLRPDAVVPVGMEGDPLIPYPPHAYPGYRLLQEFLVLPEKFLFLELRQLERWVRRGGGNAFDVDFVLASLPDWMPEVRPDSFVLNATPAVNLFSYGANPVALDHLRTEYRLTPAGTNRAHFQIYSVDSVVGLRQGMPGERRYRSFGYGERVGGEATYHTALRPSATGRGIDVYLSVAYPPGELPVEETLSIEFTCSNGNLSEGLRLGDISQPTDTSPEQLSFRNIRVPTPYLTPAEGEGILWRLLSHLTLNYLSLADAENFKSLLGLYLFSDRQERGADVANRRRIEGIEAISVEPAHRLVSGIMMRGRNIRMRCRADHFASNGDLYLFGAVVDRFLGAYASINSYTRFELEDSHSGEVYRWPERIGQQALI